MPLVPSLLQQSVRDARDLGSEEAADTRGI